MSLRQQQSSSSFTVRVIWFITTGRNQFNVRCINIVESEETDTSALQSTTSLQPNKSPQAVLRQPRRTLPSQTILDTTSKLGHNL
jgi:hypothetical protein